MVCPDINRSFIPIKILYFLFYGGIASFLPFKTLYQKQLGMSTAQNGIIEATFQIVPIVSTPLTGIVADKTKAYKLLVGACLFFAGAFTVPFHFVPTVDRNSSWNGTVMCCSQHIDGVVACHESYALPNSSFYAQQSSNANVVFDTDLYQNCSKSQQGNDTSNNTEKEIYGETFALILCLTSLMAFFFAPVTPLVDSSALESIGQENADVFGFQRMWGSAGFGIVGLCIGYLTDAISPPEIYGQSTKNYLIAISGTAVLWGCAIIVMSTSVTIVVPKATGILRGLRSLICKTQVIFFLFIILISGFSMGVQFSFLFWYLQDFKDFQQIIIGLAVLETSLAEIPMFWISGWVCRKLGCVSALSIGLCAFGTRFILYTFVTGPWQILAFEWLHGIAFALPMAALCTYASSIAPSGAVATLVSISHATHWQIGYMSGAFFGGLVYQSFGAITLFRGTAVLCFTCAAIYWLCFGQFGILLTTKSRRNKAEIPASSIGGEHDL